MFSRVLLQGNQVRRFTIGEAANGWELTEECDNRVVRRVRYHDWHRVERALLSLHQEVLELEQGGWRPVPYSTKR